MTKAVSGVDRLINSIPHDTQQTVKSIFFLVMLGFAVGGAVYGVTMGKEAAKIKSAPIIESTNDAFELDIKREHGDGNFSSMLDSEVINEMKSIDMGKIQFPTRTSLEPEADRGIIEPDTGRKVKETPGVIEHDPLFESGKERKPVIDSDVKPIEKRSGHAEGAGGSLLEDEQKELGPLRQKGPAAKGAEDSSASPDVKPLEKKRSAGEDIRGPEPIHREEGILGD